ncbi:glycosyl transferase family 9 [Desulfovibrio sp. X2]|uniref:glycosyltransferase family 9 protein n=1 Tax=Desulfovibrio sp. X2 TaxID=941449 RepID=UPI000358AEC8|nr:glycosyltransferase family 9 protein [Desulfovibrio sp. X2]EPR42315.1 glycosyl transferase family 9 [Desulfovibrio sp. X2]
MNERFLVIQLARFGDLVQTKRLILTLARRGEVHLCLDRSLTSLAGLLFPHAVLHPLRAHAAGLAPGQGLSAIAADNLPVFAELAACDFSEVYNLNFSGLNFSLARLFDPDRVRGYVNRDGQETRDTWADMAFRWTRQRGPYGLNLVDFWAFHAAAPLAPGEVNPAAVPKGGGVGVVLAGRNQRRSLPPEVLGPAASALWSRKGQGPLYLLGAAGEREAGEAVAAHLPRAARGAVKNLAGRTDWEGLFDVVASLDALLTPDTGTMHLAAHLGTPVHAVFLSSAWCFETGPYGEGHTVWQATAECAPCVESRPCDFGVRCLEPFAGKDFLRLLTGRGGEAPHGMACLASRLDALGVDYAPERGSAPFAAERAAFRAFLARHLGLADAVSAGANALTDEFLLERDWLGGPDPRRLQQTANGCLP